MSDLQRKIRREVKRAEDAAASYLEWVDIYREIGWVEALEKALRDYNHFNARRSFFLKELLSIQLKEFKREEEPCS